MNKSKNKVLFKRILIIVVVLIILYFIISKIFLTTKPTIYKEPKVMIGENIVDLKDNVIIDELENIYLSINDVNLLWKQEAQYDEENKTLIVLFNNHELVLQLDNNKILVDGKEEIISGRMQLSSGNLYLPISDLKDVYNSRFTYSSYTNIVIIDYLDNKTNVAVIKKNSYIKDGNKLFSKKYLKTQKDEKVTILDNTGEYYKIRTKDGIIGYVKANRILD